MEALIIIVIIGIVWLLIYLNKADTKFKNANRLIDKKRYDEAQETLFKLTSKHSLAVTQYALCFFIKAQEFNSKGKVSDAIINYNKVLESKKLLTIVSDKPSFDKLAEGAFFEISKLQFESISTNVNSLERIKALNSNLDYIKKSEFNKSNEIPQLIEKHNDIISALYFKIGKDEERAGNFKMATRNYFMARAKQELETQLRYNAAGRFMICHLKWGEMSLNFDKFYFEDLEKADKKVRKDFYLRYAIILIKAKNFSEAENIISTKLDYRNSEIDKLKELCWNEKIKSATNEITSINSQINEIYNNTATIDLLVGLYDSVTDRGNELNKVIPGIINDLEGLKPSLLNRILQHYNENSEYGKAIKAIIKFPEFYNSPLLMKNLGNASYNYLKYNTITAKNYKIIISLFLTSAYSDKVMLSSLEETIWDDEYTFSLIEAVGSNYELHSEIPENVNYDEISESNISIGEAQKYLISEFENLLNEKVTDYELHNEVFKFYQNEKQSLEDIIQIIPNEIVFATPYFAKRFNIFNHIIDELEHDFSEYKNEESLKAGIPYINDNRDLWINDYFEAQKTIDALIDSINQVDISKFSNSFTASRKKLIYKFESLVESMELRIIDSLNGIAKKQSTSEIVLDLIRKSVDILPNNDKLKYLYSGYAANLCVTKINSDKMTIYKGLQIMSNAYKLSPNDSRVCTNLIALIRMNILDILNQRSSNISSVYSILDNIKTNRSITFKNNAGELLKTRNEILDDLPSEARIAITSGVNLNNNGRQLKKGLDYLAQLGGSSTIKDPLSTLREQLGLV